MVRKRKLNLMKHFTPARTEARRLVRQLIRDVAKNVAKTEYPEKPIIMKRDRE